MQKTVIGNWKMYGEPEMAHALAHSAAQKAAEHRGRVQIVLCPPATLLPVVSESIAGTGVQMGGQDCHVQPEGAYTGDVSANMLRMVGCRYVLVGHSERRKYHNEQSRDVSHKAARAIKSGLIPVICIGETEEERDSGKTRDVLAEQIRESIPEEALAGDFILAYEPVWAIGSGKTPTLDDIRDIHTYITSFASKRTGLDAKRVVVLYGGSVKPANAAEIMALEGVAGVLVGGASLKPEEFCRIIDAAA
jgi:triosephosphate isomerase